MKKYACVLAAGKGSRLKKITEDSSKWMVEVNNLSLMERYLIAFKTNNIENIIVVLGHASQNLKKSILTINKNLNLNLIFIKNDLYDKTNNIFSLNIALKEILKIKDLDRLIIAECDIFFARGSIDKFLNIDIGNHILASPYEYWMDGSCISLDDNDRIKSLLNKNEVIKSKSTNLFKTVNWYSFDKEYIQNQLAPFINTYSTNISAVSYYELVIKILLEISEVRLDLFKIHPSKWVEIDDSYDLQLAECFDDADNGNIKPFVNRYGGFWKFPWITDLTLLVNPYFPPKEMIKEIYKLNDVIGRNYPSSQEVLSNLVSKSFLVEKDEIIVANGVCEILMNILTKIKGDFEIKVPFFLEYSRALGDRLIEVNELDDFSFKNNIIIVNPNNPDGEVLDLGIIKSIAKKLEKNGEEIQK